MTFKSRDVDPEYLMGLPVPPAVEPLNFEATLAEMKADFLELFPDAAKELEIQTSPLLAQLRHMAATKVKMSAEINDRSRLNFLTHTFGSGVDNFGAFWSLERKTVRPADNTTTPPTPAVMERDEDLKKRTFAAPAKLAAAGPKSAFESHALDVDPAIKKAKAISHESGETSVYLYNPDAEITAEQIAAVSAYLAPRTPLCAHTHVQAAGRPSMAVTATLYILPGQLWAEVEARAMAALRAYEKSRQDFGLDIIQKGVLDALFCEGVQDVSMAAPTENLAVAQTDIAQFGAVVLINGGERA